MEKAKKFAAAAITIVFALIGAVVAKGFVQVMMEPDERTLLINANKRAAEEINAQGPLHLDDVTTMTGAEARDTRLVYFYVIKGARADYTSTVAAEIQAMVIRSACAQEPMKKNMRAGGEFEYLYRDELGAVVANFAIARTSCGI